MKLGCVIMASGEGKRFGSNKMLADIYGEPLIARTIDSVPRGFDVVVSTRWRAAQRKRPCGPFVGSRTQLERLSLFAGRPAARECGFF